MAIKQANLSELKLKNMKNFKKLGIGLAALALAFGLVFSMSAFKNTPKSNALQWFVFNGDADDDVNDQSLYEAYTPSPENPTPVDCGGSTIRCAIYAEPDMSQPGKPNLSTIDHDETLLKD